MDEVKQFSVTGRYHLMNLACMQDAAGKLGLNFKIVTLPGGLTPDGQHRLPKNQIEVEITGKSDTSTFWSTAEGLRSTKGERFLG